ncbi:MAG: phosphonate C-P lyase system protein PhnG [Desulfofustis sp.]|jgi:alpha-D-ribose 1-methylphosphonate 5-triphosphate synthase subunit PhnG|nr:phosphonate C-P lyase system protein PhnG [Desulfofustis sp.]
MEREALNYYLQHVPIEQLQDECGAVAGCAHVEFIGKATPQTLLVPARDPITGGTFFAGEVLVTSCIVRVNEVPGWAMVMDDRPELAGLVATLDAAFAAGIRIAEITALAGNGSRVLAQHNSEMNRRTSATRVSFDLL